MYPCLLSSPKFLEMTYFLLFKTVSHESCDQIYCLMNQNHFNIVFNIVTMETENSKNFH